MHWRILQLLILSSAIILVACNKAPQISDYPPYIDLPYNERVAGVPVIVVGRIRSSARLGQPRPSRWGVSDGMQLYRVDVTAENVLQRKVPAGEFPVYYFIYLRASGPPRIGMSGFGGSWRVGDREMFFLQSDSGVLRTICDTWAHCVLPVFTGAHPDFKARPRTPGRLLNSRPSPHARRGLHGFGYDQRSSEGFRPVD